MNSQMINKGKRNVLFSVSSSLILLALGLLVPKFVVVSYGSEINGLLSSTLQLLSYLAILEAGLASLMRNSLYGEFASHNVKNISGIFTAGTKYYRRVSYYYGLCLIVASIIFTCTIKTDISRITIFLVVLLSGLSSIVSFAFLSSIKNVIEADGNYYFIAILDVAFSCLTYIITIIAAIFKLHIVVIKLLSLVARLIYIFIFRIYFKCNYGWINKKETPQFDKFKQRKYYVIHQLANLLFSTTDIMLLTYFENLVVVSIYTLYNSVITAIQTLMNSLSSSLVFALGQTYKEDINKYYRLHDAFKCFYIQANFILITTCYYLFVPFVNIYMKGVDVNYADDKLALLFCLISLLNCSRMLDNNLAARTFKMKETTHHVLIEAGINLAVSILLVQKIGIYGVLLGTCAAILFRWIVSTHYSEKSILHRSLICGYKHAILNWGIFGVCYLLKKTITLRVDSYLELFLVAGLVGIAAMLVYLVLNGIVFRQEYALIASTLLNRKDNKRQDNCV